MTHEHLEPAGSDRIPPEEWRTPERAIQAPGSFAMRLAMARTGFLRYAVAGGAVIGAFVAAVASAFDSSSVADGDGRSATILVMTVGIFVGFGLGTVIGWVSFRLVERYLGAATWSPTVARAVAIGLTIPAYLIAGVSALIAGALVQQMPAADVVSFVPGVTLLLLVGGVVLLPIAAAFGRSDRTRPRTLMDALSQGDDLLANPSDPSRTFWAIAVGIVMFIVGFFPVLLLIGVIERFGPNALADVGRVLGPVFGIIILGVWIGSGVLGWKLTMRVIDSVRRQR